MATSQSTPPRKRRHPITSAFGPQDVGLLLNGPDPATPCLTDAAGLLCAALVPLSCGKRGLLRSGRFAIISEVDEALVTAHPWGYSRGYAVRRPRVIEKAQGAPRDISMHRAILVTKSDIDHKNGNGTDNRRSNIRPCNDAQNQQNRVRLPKNTSGFRGATWHKQSQRWQAGIKVRGRSIHLGLHGTAELAARAYDAAAIKYFGEFARPNFPVGGAA